MSGVARLGWMTGGRLTGGMDWMTGGRLMDAGPMDDSEMGSSGGGGPDAKQGVDRGGGGRLTAGGFGSSGIPPYNAPLFCCACQHDM